MAKYKSYPQHRPINDYWVDELPSHWRYVSLRWLARIYAGGTPDKKNEDYWLDGSIPWLASGEVNQWDVTVPTTHITEEAYANSSAKWIPEGSLILALAGQGKTKGMVAQLQFTATCNQSLAAIAPIKIDGRFLLYWLHSSYKNLRGLAGGDLRDGLNLDLIGSVSIPMPSHDEQQAIAAFLDHETAKINRLIAKQERLIELLKEKRQAVISHAVTKGLNPDAPMKDSGVEWLGEVPAHWVVSKFAYVKTVLTDYTANGAFADLKKNVTYKDDPDFARLVRLTDLRKDLKNENGVWIDEHAYRYLSKSALFGGEFLLANVGAYAGLFYQMPYINEAASLAPNMFMAKFSPFKILGKFMAYVGRSDAVYKQLRLMALASSAQPKLNKDDFKATIFAYPPLDEQESIVNYLDVKLKRIDLIVKRAEQAVELLKEHRTALICAAVTGKIDVRGWNKPNTEPQAATTAASA